MTGPQPNQIRGWHVLAALIAFFALVTAVDGVFIFQAVKTFPGQVSVTPYEDGLLYNRQLAQLKSQDRLGWVGGAQARQGEIEIEVRDRAAAPVRGLAVAGTLRRPATEAGQIALKFSEAKPGVYTAQVDDLSGAWDLNFDAAGAAGQSFHGERRLTWP